MPNARSLIYR